ncbi:hypothetical protein [Paenibacillus phage SV21]|nr:hypothetical protein [Paenibacillus phage SV21]
MEDIDFEKELSSFEDEWTEDNPSDEEEIEEEDQDKESESDDGQSESDEEEVQKVPDLEPEDEEEEPDENQEDVSKSFNKKQNSAFAEMRRTNKELQEQLAEKGKYVQVLEQLANEKGMSLDSLVEALEERKLEVEAEQKNMPVEALKRMKELEKRTQELEELQIQQRFNQQMHDLVNNYSLSQDDIDEFFKQVEEKGINVLQSDVETIYKALNFDKLLQKTVEEKRQAELAEKKKRQRTSTEVVKGGGNAPEAEEISDEFVDATLKRFGISI